MPERRLTIAQMDFQRRALRARLSAGDVGEAEAQAIIRKIEDLELAIAASPAASVADIGVKATILKETLSFQESDNLEAVLLEAVVRDCLTMDS